MGIDVPTVSAEPVPKTASLDTPKGAPKTAPKPSFLTACQSHPPFGFSKLCKPWEKELNPIQDKLATPHSVHVTHCVIAQCNHDILSYVLDTRRPGAEIIIKEGPTCLTREEFWSLGLPRDMDSQIGNACFKLIHEAAQPHGKDIYIEDMYVIPTWKCTPKNMAVNFPEDVDMKDLLVFPAWTNSNGPEHFVLCVRDWYCYKILDSTCSGNC
ncbi:uncharacterized protein LOC122142532 [Cyprinus carpio]|uniref:Uncharacterized protein LOC122142532 n=1 Tax=Cyprinus carpio TaxID=7962 RepID=A0A9R0AT03_CYPCA|nr:uncharacterized protein LOC122142532 [Cyprinus carpio]